MGGKGVCSDVCERIVPITPMPLPPCLPLISARPSVSCVTHTHTHTHRYPLVPSVAPTRRASFSVGDVVSVGEGEGDQGQRATTGTGIKASKPAATSRLVCPFRAVCVYSETCPRVWCVCLWTEFVCVGVVDVCWCVCVCMYVFMCACVCLCVYVRTYVCVSIWIYITGIARPALAWMLPRQYVGLVQPKRRRWEILFCGWPWRERACVFMSGLRSWSTGCTALLVLQMPQ